MNSVSEDLSEVWFHSLEILSMDQTDGFFSPMGLPIKRTEKLQEIAQEYVRAIRDQQPEKLAQQNALHRIRSELGDEVAEAIQQWTQLNHRRYPDEDWASIRWVALFGRLTQVFDFYDFPLVPLNLPEPKLQSIKIAFLLCLAKAYRMQLSIEAVRKCPLSAWDEYVYSEYTHGTSPLAEVSNQVTFIYHMLMWQEIEDLLTASEFEMLGRWGQQQSEVISRMIEEREAPPLVHPPIGIRHIGKAPPAGSPATPPGE